MNEHEKQMRSKRVLKNKSSNTRVSCKFTFLTNLKTKNKTQNIKIISKYQSIKASQHNILHLTVKSKALVEQQFSIP